ncbi:hypothetical protein ACLOJK_011999 [Asimina triloba]
MLLLDMQVAGPRGGRCLVRPSLNDKIRKLRIFLSEYDPHGHICGYAYLGPLVQHAMHRLHAILLCEVEAALALGRCKARTSGRKCIRWVLKTTIYAINCHFLPNIGSLAKSKYGTV